MTSFACGNVTLGCLSPRMGDVPRGPDAEGGPGPAQHFSPLSLEAVFSSCTDQGLVFIQVVSLTLCQLERPVSQHSGGSWIQVLA